MVIYSYSEARQKLAAVLDEADSTGKVFIRRRDGRTYALVPEAPPHVTLGRSLDQREHLYPRDRLIAQPRARENQRAEKTRLTSSTKFEKVFRQAAPAG
ncbi:MAG: type II toxin-antitoxin system Phd/YefM family antitoxin [Candidatus Aminicenantes bacterium]|nr:type II toxin-antitoxin system Phd/YefM family antitoxin [Candidatus Aminicenantes bacterium]